MDTIENIVKKAGWVILILICCFFLFVGVKAVWTAPATERQLKSAVWVEDGAVHSENEGKLVAVVFHPGEWENAEDTDMDISFSYPVVRRTVQQLNRVGTRYLWQDVDSGSDTWLTDAVFIGAVQGENAFTIDPQLLVSMNTAVECGESDFTQEALERLTASVEEISYDGYLWFSEAPYSCMKDLEENLDADVFNKTFALYKSYEGARRIRYNVMDLSDVERLVIVGYQQGSTLVKAEDLDSMTVYENASSLDDILKSNKSYLSLGLLIVGIICIGLIVLAVKKIRE